MSNQSLKQIIDELPKEFTEKVIAMDSVALLKELRWETTCKNKLALIDARIANINYLVA